MGLPSTGNSTSPAKAQRAEPIERFATELGLKAVGATEDLVGALARGDEVVWEGFARKAGKWMYIWSSKVYRHKSDQEDIAQQALLKVYVDIPRQVGQMPAPCNLYRYLQRITVNEALMKLRGDRDRINEPIDNFDPEETSPNAEEALGNAQESCRKEALIRACLTRLMFENPNAATIIYLRYFVHLPYDQIVSETGIEIKSAYHYCCEGLARLRELLRRPGGAK